MYRLLQRALSVFALTQREINFITFKIAAKLEDSMKYPSDLFI